MSERDSANRPAFLFHPTQEMLDEFHAKVIPIVSKLAEERGIPFKARLLNLTMGITPKTKAERAFADEALRRIWRAYPNALFPKMCATPPEAEPLKLVVVSGGSEVVH
jgi:hypothetical protein